MSTTIVTPNAAMTPGQPTELTMQPQETALAAPMPSSITTNSDLPDYMLADLAKGGSTGTELMRDYVRPPQIRIVQSVSPIKGSAPEYAESACYAHPSNSIILPAWQENQPLPTVQFAVCFFYPEFIEWNPRGADAFGLTKIRSRTTNPDSELAARCKSFDKKIRSYQCPEMSAKASDKTLIQCQEHLNFIICLIDHPELAGVPMLLSFSRGSYKDGKRLIELIRIRRNVKIFGLMFDLSVGERFSENNERYYAPDVRSTATADGRAAFVDAEWYNWLKQQHEMLDGDYQAGLIKADYDDTESTVVTPAPSTAAQPNRF